jgi:hypothetical protein
MSVDYDIEEEVLEAEEDVETPGREEERKLSSVFTLTRSGTEEIGHGSTERDREGIRRF